jgi:hypothetical protein
MLHHISHDVLAACLFAFGLHLACKCQIAGGILPIDISITFEGKLVIPLELDFRWIRGEFLKFLEHLLLIHAVIVDRDCCLGGRLNPTVFLFLNRWVEASPLLFKQHCKLRIANGPSPILVKIAEQRLYVVKTQFYSHVLHCLGKFVECNTLSVVHVEEAEAALQIFETLTYFSRNYIKQHSYVLLFCIQLQRLMTRTGMVFANQAFTPLVLCAFGIRRHNVS